MQLYRNLSDFGVYRLLLFLFFISTVSYILYQFFSNPNNTKVILAVIFFSIGAIHLSRKDKHFLNSITQKSYLINWSEYLLLSLPVLVAFAIYHNWQGILGVLAIIFLIPILFHKTINHSLLGSVFRFILNPINVKFDLNTNFSIPFLSPLAFEWITGIRRSFIALVPVYLIVTCFSFKLLVAPIGIIVLALFISGFYYEGESRELIEVFAKSPKEFIWRKIKMACTQLVCIALPILLISLIFQTETWFYNIIALVLSALILAITIILKYSLFAENSNLNKNGNITAINIAGILLPIIWPLPLIMGIIHYRKALKKLKPYFNAGN